MHKQGVGKQQVTDGQRAEQKRGAQGVSTLPKDRGLQGKEKDSGKRSLPLLIDLGSRVDSCGNQRKQRAILPPGADRCQAEDKVVVRGVIKKAQDQQRDVGKGNACNTDNRHPCEQRNF